MRLVEERDIHLIFLQESWLDASYESVELPNFTLLSRRDRSKDPNRGGVVAYMHHNIKNLTHIMHADIGERFWHMLQRDTASIAFCNW